MAHDVFVSYSSIDKPIADAIVAGLEADGIRCWFAPRDVTPGTSWGKTIVEAIESCKVMVIVLSENSNRSHQVLREVERAVSNEVIIIPFRIENIEPTGAMAYYLSTEHWLDALTPPLKGHINKLSHTIQLFILEGEEKEIIETSDVIEQPLKPRSRWLLPSMITLAVGGVIAIIIFIVLPLIKDSNAKSTGEMRITKTEEVVISEENILATGTPLPDDQSYVKPDSILIVEEPSIESAINKIQNGEIHAYSGIGNDPEAFQTVLDQELSYFQTIGYCNEITLNPAGPIFEDGQLNPFADQKIREAMNWLIDRDYIAEEILGGLALPKYLPISNYSPDYNDFADVVRELEVKYAYDPAKAEEIITKQMALLGAEFIDGTWTYKDEPITLIFLIRNEDKRQAIGNYVSDKLESIGFKVDRKYMPSEQAAGIWMNTPERGQWHLYTGGWISSTIHTDQGDYFSFFSSPKGLPPELNQTYDISDEFDHVCNALDAKDFNSLEERADLFTKALRLSMEYSFHIWLVHETTFWPMASNVEMAYDLAGGLRSTPLWTRTLRIQGEEENNQFVMGVLEVPDTINPIMIENNPLTDQIFMATGDYAAVFDPYTGLVWPNRIESAAVTVEEGIPIRESLDWVAVNYSSEIRIPDKAWVDWDASNDTFITAEEKAAEEEKDYLTAETRSVITYPADLFEMITWHDGSQLSLADFVLSMVLYFDYEHLSDQDIQGIRITSKDPLIIEFYSNNPHLDAERYMKNVIFSWPLPIWPQYQDAEVPWHTMAIGLMAESAGELAFTEQEAQDNNMEWMSYISGPSLEILKAKLDQAINENLIPYKTTLSEFLSEEEISTRYSNLLDWYEGHGHFWISAGPFYIDEYSADEKSLTLNRFKAYPDSQDKWDDFISPKIAEVSVDGPNRVTIGKSVIYDIYVTYDGDPYPDEDIKDVRYLVLDASDVPVEVGDAELIQDGHYRVVLSAEMTNRLEAGYSNIDFVIIPSVVVIPSFYRVEIVISN